jgi:hypothetical protein
MSGLFDGPTEAIESIRTDQGSTEVAARRAIIAKSWLTSYYGRKLDGMPDDLRKKFVAEIETIAEGIACYADHYPWPSVAEEEPEPMDEDELMAVYYTELRELLEQLNSQTV